VVPVVAQSGGQLLARLQDLLHDDPRAAGLLGQPVEVAAGIGQAVRVVDAQAVQHAVAHLLQQQRVRGVEDLRDLDAHPGQRRDVEEAAVVSSSAATRHEHSR
jgi:hypothetical protein